MSSTRPIFLLGIMQRCGTNFLNRLLLLHPDLQSHPVSEDYLIAKSHNLFQYVEQVSRHWNPSWDPDGAFRRSLIQHLGNSILLFLQSNIHENKRLIAKTPSVSNVSQVFNLFSHVDLVILIRDGRDVVESGIRSFGWRFEGAIQKYARRTNEIQSFIQSNLNDDFRYLLVKYEELVLETETTMRKILEFLRLDDSCYDFKAIQSIPVFGSSTYKRKGAVDWKPVEKTSGFNPIRRWSRWSLYQKKRFYWIAGESIVFFNYMSRKECIDELNFFWRIMNRCIDFIIRCRRILSRIARRS